MQVCRPQTNGKEKCKQGEGNVQVNLWEFNTCVSIYEVN